MVVISRKGDAEATRVAEYVLEESGERIDLRKGWEARPDKRFADTTQDHVHLYLRGKQVGVINRDGTPSHNSDLSVLPNRIIKALKKINLIEGSIDILEASMDDFSVPFDVMAEMLETLARRAKYARIFRNIGYPK